MTTLPVPGTGLVAERGPDGWGVAWQTPAGRFVQELPVAVDLAPDGGGEPATGSGAEPVADSGAEPAADSGASPATGGSTEPEPATAWPGERRGRGYATVEVVGQSLVCEGAVPLDGDAALVVRDTWTVADDELRVRRDARVRGTGGSAFACRLTLRRDGPAHTWADVAPFVPGVAYGDAPRVALGALGGVAARRTGVRAVLVREDRTAAPLVVVRYPDGHWLALLHVDPDGGTVAADGCEPDGGDMLVDDRLRYAALGGVATGAGLELGLWYPGLEGEYTYSSGGLPLGQPHRWRLRYHPARDGLRQGWTLALRAGTGPAEPAGGPPAWSGAWRWAWRTLGPSVAPVDTELVERRCLEVLASQVVDDGRLAGVPLEADAVRPGRTTEDTSAVMGFVGANTDAAALLIRAGDRRGDAEGARWRGLGERILDTFVRLPLDPPAGEGFDTADGTVTTYRTVDGRPAVYARALAEGCLAALDTARWDERHGRPRPAWRAWARAGAEWLVAAQRDDGALPRAWEAGTGAVLDPSPSATALVVPHLLAVADDSGEARFRRAALAAAEHSWRTAGESGAYAGATLDNPDVVDKEAAVLAAEAYLGAHHATGERRWLDRAVSAASVAETWIYAWDVPMPADGADADRHWKRGVPTVGHQLITTGASMVDGFLAADAALFATLWLATGDAHWLDVARVVTHGTTAMLALDGRTFDLRGPGWQQEHWSFAPRRGYGLNRRWLTWVPVAHVRGIQRVRDLGEPAAAAVLGAVGAAG